MLRLCSSLRYLSSKAMEIPVIDMPLLMDSTASKQARQKTLRAMYQACTTLGFFTIPTNVLPRGLLQRVYSHVDAFNSLPEATKRKYHINNVPNRRGWTPLLEEPSYIPGVLSYLEGYDVAQELPPSYLAMDNRLGPNVWPEELPAFRVDVMALYDSMSVLSCGLLESFAQMLDLPRNTFLQFYTLDAQADMRLLTYPANAAPKEGSTIGISEHTDFECFTILHQTNYGLQVRTVQGDVVDVPVEADRLIILPGDVLERWTNGFLQATPHLVYDTTEKRQSIARFTGAKRSAIIEPLAPFVSVEHPAKYEPVTQRELTENALKDAEKVDADTY